MPQITVETALGRFAITEGDGAVTGLAWGAAERREPSPLLARAAAQLAEYAAGTRRHFDLPLAPAGTAFQRRVWRELIAIPFGATMSYGALAEKLGTAARAVGGACGANPIPIIIPCHRVVASDGRLGGFSGGDGLDSKLLLLAHEGVRPRQASLFANRRAAPERVAPNKQFTSPVELSNEERNA